MEYSATAKYVRVSPRKMRVVVDGLTRLQPTKALMVLQQMPHSAAEPISKVIQSALANAREKGIQPESLIFRSIDVMGGPFMKRWHAVSRGQAHGFKKRMTHIRVTLTDQALSDKTPALTEDKRK